MARLPEEDRQQAARRQARRQAWREEYAVYLRSPHWQQRRARSLKLAKYACQFCDNMDDARCGDRSNLSIHHLSYERRGAELDEDLIVLCRRHHLAYELMKEECDRCCGPAFDSLTDAADFVTEHIDEFEPDDDVLDSLRDLTPDLCPYCEHMTSKDD